MDSKLLSEAEALCRRLMLAQLDEEERRNYYGRRCGDPGRIQRLERIRRKAADRWRRRAGFDALASMLEGGAA